MAVNIFTSSNSILSWSSPSNWSLGVVPSNNGDLVVFTSSSATCSLDITGTCSQIDFSHYNKSFNFNANTLRVYGNITLGTQMSYSFSTPTTYGSFIMCASGSITSNGATFGAPLAFYIFATAGNNYYTLNDNLVVSEGFETAQSAGGLTHFINGNTLTTKKYLSINNGSNSSNSLTTGTTNIIMNGVGSLSITNNISGGLGNSLTLTGTGTFSLHSSFYVNGGTFSIIGTPGFFGSCILYSTNNFNFIAASSSVTNKMPIGFGGYSSGSTITLGSDFYSSNGLTNGYLTLNNYNFWNYGSINSITIYGSTILNFGNGTSIGTLTIYGMTANIAAGSGLFSVTTSLSLISGGSLTYISGTCSFPGTLTFPSILQGPAFSGTLDLKGNNVLSYVNSSGCNVGSVLIRPYPGVSCSLPSQLSCVGQFNNDISAAASFYGATISVGGNLIVNYNGISGTSPMVFIGTGSIYGNYGNPGGLGLNLTINTPGTVTFTGSFGLGSGANGSSMSFTYVTGSVVVAPNSTLILYATTLSINSGPIVWNNISNNENSTFNILSPLNIAGAYTRSSVGNMIFAGPYGFSASTFNSGYAIGGVSNIYFSSGVTYSVSNNLVLNKGSLLNLYSSNSGVQAKLILAPSASQTVRYVNATDIDSSGGQRINSYFGIFNNTLNWIWADDAKTFYIKASQADGISINQLYDMTDNQNNYVFQRLSGTKLLLGLTLSINNSANIFTFSSFPLSATWSYCNPQQPGLNC